MEQRISLITLGVASLEASRLFYERMGWRPAATKAEGVVFFQAGGMALALYPRPELRKDAGVRQDGASFAGFTLAYNTRSRDEVHDVALAAEKAGATILQPPQETSWGGYAAYFADPDGFVWEIAWNPSFPIAEDGSVRLPD